MDNNENADIIKHEKLKLHMKYMIAITIIISLGSVVLSSYCQDAFVAQVSFAATITSIVLSVIAIWMSISGERSTSDIKTRITESTERLSKTTQEVETLNSNYKETMDTQLTELKNVQEQLTKIINSVDDVKEQFSFINKNNVVNSNNNIMDTEQRIALFHNIFSWEPCGDYYYELIFCKMVKIIITKHQNNSTFSYREVLNYLRQDNINIYSYRGTINIYWGIINTLLAVSIFDDEDAVHHILQFVDDRLNP